MSRRLRVALLAGGRSSEHDISLLSARSVLEALDPERYEVVNVAIGRDGRWELGSGDGSVAETLPVPWVHPVAVCGPASHSQSVRSPIPAAQIRR